MDFAQAHALNSALRSIGMRHRALAGALLAPLDLNTGQEVMLLELAAHGPCTQRHLADAGGCEPPTITHAVRRLEAAGLVVRHPSPTDGRATMVELSDDGRALVTRLKDAWVRLAELTVSELRSTDTDTAIRAVDDLAESLRKVSRAEPTSASRDDR